MPFISRLLAASLAVVATLHPSMAETTFYYRSVQGALPGLPPGPTAPGAGTNTVVKGNGELNVYGPVQVRARIGVAFFLPLTTDNAQGDVTWSVVGGSLPDGLSLSPSGLLSGVPVASSSATGLSPRKRGDRPGRVERS